jgi:DNA polymerase III gamma/tau subunit
MSDNVLYLKYRPQTLEDIMGNENVVNVLKSYFEGASPFPRSILFHGPTGCGKTTLGRIVASELGAKGGDLKEIDSADFRGIDTIRDIRKKSIYKPLESPCRVWILDEVHRATGDAQSALLKALEDTPEHVYYILCTTDPQKLLPTIRGRCAQFQVEPLLDRDMKLLLRKVVKGEDEKISKEVYDQIAQDSLGHPRNALQILSQVLAVEEEKRLITAKRTAEIQSKTIELCRALIKGSPWQTIAGILKGLKTEDPEQIRRAVLGYCQSVLLNNENNTAATIMEEFMEPFYNSGFPALTLACYSVLFGD